MPCWPSRWGYLKRTCRLLLPVIDALDKQGGDTTRFEAVCFDCPGWDECSDCSIGRGDITPTCEAPLEHTSADEPGVTLETLNVSRGYWRVTNTSDNILACYNADACVGGATGADNYCALGYAGPCEERYKRHRVGASVAMLVVVFRANAKHFP